LEIVPVPQHAVKTIRIRMYKDVQNSPKTAVLKGTTTVLNRKIFSVLCGII
jgi:hypothetical protein